MVRQKQYFRILGKNYLARRLVISLFSAALWAPVAEATSRGRTRTERREEEAIYGRRAKQNKNESQTGRQTEASVEQAGDSGCEVSSGCL